ncbi:MAG: glycosyltransferase family 9 protein [Chloroflexota bacterium]|nr:glycosyltransferase family 9 protein [Chloroflexota bacterium]
MERELLVERNRRMAAAFHTVPLKHRFRRVLLQTLAGVPFPPSRPNKEVERILIVRPDHLGDALLTTPAIRALRAARPNAEIHALVGAWSAGVLAPYPEIDLVLTLPFPGFARTSIAASATEPYVQAWRAAGDLRRLGYRAALICRPDHWWGALIAYWAGIPARIGYAHVDTAPFLTDALPIEPEHAVMQSARLVERLTNTALKPEALPLTFPVDADDRAWVDGYLDEWGLNPRERLFAIHPGSGAWVKQWDESNWAFVADTLADEWDATPVFTGSESELPMIQRIVTQMKRAPCIMAGDTRIGTLAALYERAHIVLGPDSGPLHLAVALDVPTVTLYGAADPVEFGSWGARARHAMLYTDIGCRPCRVLNWDGDDPKFHPCVREITLARVLHAARSVTSTL